MPAHHLPEPDPGNDHLPAPDERRPVRHDIARKRAVELTTSLVEREEREDEDEIDLLAYWRMLVKRRWLILSVITAVLAIALVRTLLTPPTYRATSTLEIDPVGMNVMQVQGISPTADGGWDPDFAQTQIQLLQSRGLAQRVAEDLRLPGSNIFTRIEPPSWLQRLRGLVAPGPRASAVVATANAAPAVADPPAAPSTRRGGPATRASAATLASTTGLIQGGLTIEPIRNTHLVQIHYDSTQPAFSAQVANAVATGFIASSMDRQVGASSYASKYLQDQLDQLRSRLEDSEAALVAYAKQANLVPSSSGASLTTQNLTDLNSQLATAQAQRIAAEASWNTVKATRGTDLPQTILQGSIIPALQTNLAQLQIQYQQNLKTFKPGFPTMLALKSQIDSLQQQIAGASLAVLIPLARATGLLDRPGGRKHHRGAVPLVGGLSILCGLLASALWLDGLNAFERALLATVSALVVIGALDDRFNLGVKRRVVMQSVLILALMAATGVYVQHLGNLFGFDAQLGWLGVPFTLVAMIGLLNAFNLIDGIDGLASLLAMIAIAAIVYGTGGAASHSARVVLPLMLLAVLPQFACNLGVFGGRGKVFLGDAGSTLLGYVIGWVLIRDSQTPGSGLSPVTTLWCVAVPVLDTLAVMVRRIRAHRSPFKPGRGHIHYLLVDAGLAPRQALAVIGCAAVVIWSIGASVHALSLGSGSNLVAFLVVLFAYMYATARLDAWVRGGGRFRAAAEGAMDAGTIASIPIPPPAPSHADGLHAEAMAAVRIDAEDRDPR